MGRENTLCGKVAVETTIGTRLSDYVSIVDNLIMDPRAPGYKADIPAGYYDLFQKLKCLSHLTAKVFRSLMIFLEEVGPCPDLQCLYMQRIKPEPPHAVFVIKPIFIGVWVRWRRDHKTDRCIDLPRA